MEVVHNTNNKQEESKITLMLSLGIILIAIGSFSLGTIYKQNQIEHRADEFKNKNTLTRYEVQYIVKEIKQDDNGE